MARLDRLGSAKEVAQIGAAIGREFSHALLAAVMDKARGGAQSGARASHFRRSTVSAGLPAARHLSVQTCASAGHGLRHALARAAPRVARPYRCDP